MKPPFSLTGAFVTVLLLLLTTTAQATIPTALTKCQWALVAILAYTATGNQSGLYDALAQYRK